MLGRISSVVVVVCMAAPTWADVLVNGGFEMGDFTGWSVTSGYIATPPENFFEPYEGDYFARLTAIGATATQTGTDGLTPGGTLQLTGWCATDGYDYGEVVLRILDAGGGELDSTVTGAPLVGDSREWVPYALNLDVPTDAASWELTLIAHYGTYGSYVDVYWDGATMTPEPSTLAFLAVAGTTLWRRRRAA